MNIIKARDTIITGVCEIFTILGYATYKGMAFHIIATDYDMVCIGTLDNKHITHWMKFDDLDFYHLLGSTQDIEPSI